MTDASYWINWIIADYTPFEYAGIAYYISNPLRENRFLAERVFVLTYGKSVEENLLTNEEITILLEKRGLWNKDKQTNLDKLICDVDDIKVGIFNSYTQSGKKAKLREALAGTRQYIDRLSQEKQIFDQYSAMSVAMLAKQHFLLGKSIFRQRNRKEANSRSDWWTYNDDSLIQHTYKILADYILTDKDYRELSRSNYWRAMWGNRRGSNLFGRSTVDFSASQQQLVTWSNIYDNIYKHSECPSDEILEDDDAIDGWMIKQRRKRQGESNQQTIEGSISNQKILNSDEVYVMCDEKDISKVYDCNDIQGKIRWNSINNQVKKEGCVNHMKLQDTKAEIQRRIAEKAV